MADNATTNDQVIIYSTNWCAFCKTEKQYLDSKGVSYVDKNIEEDADAYKELMSKLGGNDNFRGVPVSDIRGKIVLGFNRPAIDAALAGSTA